MFRVYTSIFDGFRHKNICATKNTPLQINMVHLKMGHFLREKRRFRICSNVISGMLKPFTAFEPTQFNGSGPLRPGLGISKILEEYTLEKSHILNPKVKVDGR